MAKRKIENSGGLRAYSRHRGCTLRTVQKARDSGRLSAPNNFIADFRKADKEWKRKTRSETKAATRTKALRTRSGSADANGAEFDRARTQRETTRAAREEAEFKVYLGDLLPADEVRAAIEERAGAEREALLNWPATISGNLAAALGVPERKLFAQLERAVRKFLEERSSRLLSNVA